MADLTAPQAGVMYPIEVIDANKNHYLWAAAQGFAPTKNYNFQDTRGLGDEVMKWLTFHGANAAFSFDKFYIPQQPLFAMGCEPQLTKGGYFINLGGFYMRVFNKSTNQVLFLVEYAAILTKNLNVAMGAIIAETGNGLCRWVYEAKELRFF